MYNDFISSHGNSTFFSFLMHQSFVNTAPPPMGKGGDYDFSCYELHPQGELEVKTLLFAPPFAIENLPGERILMIKPPQFPCTAWDGTLARLSPTLPRRVGVEWGAVVINDLCINRQEIECLIYILHVLSCKMWITKYIFSCCFNNNMHIFC